MNHADRTVVYVTRDIERALAMVPADDYHIITNRTQYGESVKKDYPDFVHFIDAPVNSGKNDLLGTTELLTHPDTRKIMATLRDPALVVFKNTPRVEAAAISVGVTLLNPPASLAERIENKISQVRWLGPLSDKYLPPHKVDLVKNIFWQEKPFILQWAHGHTGDGTLLVGSDLDLKLIKEKFPERMARVTDIVRGPSFTVNISISPTTILMGNISYQITGIAPFTDNAFSTVGNDWSLTNSILNESEIREIGDIAAAIGERMQKDSWRGLCGLDIMRDDDHGGFRLIEINARQPASITFESTLQKSNRSHGLPGITMFEAHLLSLLGESTTDKPVLLNDGAQIIQRVTKIVDSVSADAVKALELAGYNVVMYENTAPHSDLLRIQSTLGIMETHGQFNSRGKEIAKILS